MERWREVVRSAEIPPGQGRSFRVDGLSIALFNDNGAFHAIDDVCPHEGASLGEGLLHDGRVICPLHSWVFELSSGRCPRGTHPGVRTFATRCVDGTVEVQVPRGK